MSRAGILIGMVFAITVASCAAHDVGTPPQSTNAPGTVEQPSSLAIDVTIAGGVVTPANAQMTAVVGKPITLVVNSDSADEIHVHSIPDHTFEVAAQQNQKFEFTVTVPGRVEVELHKLERTIAIIQVKP